MKELQNIETQLAHVFNLVDLTSEQIERIIDSGEYDKLARVLSVLATSKDIILDQIDELTSLNVVAKQKQIA